MDDPAESAGSGRQRGNRYGGRIAGWAQLELPRKVTTGADAEADRRRRPNRPRRTFTATCSATDSGSMTLAPSPADRIAIGVAHRIQRSAIQLRLAELGRQTGNRRLRDHRRHRQPDPRPGVPRGDRAAPALGPRCVASEFHLETGRLCVLLSRHRHACIVVDTGRHPRRPRRPSDVAPGLDRRRHPRPRWMGSQPPGPRPPQRVQGDCLRHHTDHPSSYNS